MKKIALVSIATLSMLLASPNGAMMMGGHGSQMKSAYKCMKQKTIKKRMNSPFLIKAGLPHMTKMVKMNWNNPVLALTPEQKQKLIVVRKETLSVVMQLKPEVMRLKREIVQGTLMGAKATEMKEKVKTLALKEAKATIVHLNCIEKTKEILTKDQLFFLLTHKKNKMFQLKRKGMM